MDLTVLLEPRLDLSRLAAALDTLGHEGRHHAIRGWGKARQAEIYEAARGFRPLTLEHFVPASIGDLTEVIHDGRNTLPAFNDFQKRFCRGADAGGVLWGYNEGPTRGFTGPGYFTVHAAEGEGTDGEIDIDYRTLPPGRCPSWPEILPNSARLGRFVWVGMVDRMRGISNNVSIGRAYKGGNAMDAWFVLVRQDAS